MPTDRLLLFKRCLQVLLFVILVFVFIEGVWMRVQ